MSLLLLAAAVPLVLAAPLPPGGPPAPLEEPIAASLDERNGLLGWGLGLELPYIGVVGGFGSVSDVGAGYCLGGAISYEITPEFLVRISGTWDATQRASGAVSYGVRGERTRSKQRAEWLDFALGVGGAYQMRFVNPVVAPYVGVDVSMTLIDGFEYRFDSELERLTIDRAQRRQFDDGRLVGRDPAIMGTLRFGVRVELSTWLASLLEIDMSYVRTGPDQINNTLNGPQVRSVGEDIWLLSGRFAVRVGL